MFKLEIGGSKEYRNNVLMLLRMLNDLSQVKLKNISSKIEKQQQSAGQRPGYNVPFDHERTEGRPKFAEVCNNQRTADESSRDWDELGKNCYLFWNVSERSLIRRAQECHIDESFSEISNTDGTRRTFEIDYGSDSPCCRELTMGDSLHNSYPLVIASLKVLLEKVYL